MTDTSGTSGQNAELARQALRHLRIGALIEGTTLVTLVCIAMPLKYGAGITQATAIMGPIHGIAFVAYVWLIFSTRAELKWSNADFARLFIPAFIPFGTFFNVGFLKRRAEAYGL